MSVQAAYNDTASDYRHVVRYAAHALDWLSHEWPGVPYPYEKTTVVQGFAGMEYPMMANDESYADTVFSRFVAEHEIAHTYFPFWMGIDETRYPFMDEGMTTATEYLLGVADLGKAKADSFFRTFRVAGWVQDPSAASDEPIITPTSTGDNGYGKPALGYLALKELLGDARYQQGAAPVHGRVARQASAAVGLLRHLQPGDGRESRLVLAELVLRAELHRHRDHRCDGVRQRLEGDVGERRRHARTGRSRRALRGRHE